MDTTSSKALEGRVAVITGASSGIGEATVLALAARGATVVMGARRQERIERLADGIRGRGGVATALPLDVTEAGSFPPQDAADADKKHATVTLRAENVIASSSAQMKVSLIYHPYHLDRVLRRNKWEC